MNLFEWLDNRNKRKFVKELLDLAIKKDRLNAAIAAHVDASNAPLVRLWSEDTKETEDEIKRLKEIFISLCR